MKIFPTKRQWKTWSFPSKATCIGVLIGVISLFVMIILHFIKPYYTDVNQEIVMGDKIINYGTFIQQEIAKSDTTNIVQKESIKHFFLNFQQSIAEIRNSIPREELKFYPPYLQKSFEINVTLSKLHGLGFEFVAPSKEAKVNIIETDMPIEKYYFSKYTAEENITKASIMNIPKKCIKIQGIHLIGGRNMIALDENGDVLLKDVWYSYSENDIPRKIEFLRLYGSNKKDYWENANPHDQANYLFLER